MSMRDNFSPRLELIERVHVFVTSGILMEYPISWLNILKIGLKDKILVVNIHKDKNQLLHVTMEQHIIDTNAGKQLS
jgi:hypothetical protein